MSIRSLLKSPSVVGGTSLAGAGSVGVGGGQIYEEVNPTLDKQLSRRGYSYSPINSPREDNPTKETFKWDNWDCMRKLFPSVAVEGKSSSSQMDNLEIKGSLLTVPEVKDDLVVCAMMDLRPVSLSEQYQNRIYFKSEVVVRGDNYGGAMGTGLSTVRKDGTGTRSDNDIYFEYNLMLFKKDKEEGKVEVGYFGLNFVQTDNGSVTLFINTPFEKGLTGQSKSDLKIPRKTWVGMAGVDTNVDSVNKDLLQSIGVYLEESSAAEFFGNNGEFYDDGAKGFASVSNVYVPAENKGGIKISNLRNYKDLSSSLKAGYAPFKKKKLKGRDLKDIHSQCYDWSTKRNQKISNLDPLLKDVCYSKN